MITNLRMELFQALVAAEQGPAGRLVAVHQQGGASQPHDLDSTNFISQPLSPCHRGNFENSPSNLHYIINVKCYSTALYLLSPNADKWKNLG